MSKDKRGEQQPIVVTQCGRTVGDVVRMAMELSPAEREEVAEILLESIDDGSDQPEFDEAWLSEIGRRVNEIQNGTAKLLTQEEVDAMIAEDQASRGM